MSDTELLWALKTGDIDEVKAKLVTTEDVNRTLDGGRNPLHYAADFGHSDVVLYLLSKEANINVTDKHGLTPLMCACYENNVACVKLLLEKGADKDIKAPDGFDLFESPELSETIKALLK